MVNGSLTGTGFAAPEARKIAVFDQNRSLQNAGCPAHAQPRDSLARDRPVAA
jgi:hypothetical protein